MAKGEAHQAGNLQAACIWRRAVKGAFPPRPRRIALYLRAGSEEEGGWGGGCGLAEWGSRSLVSSGHGCLLPGPKSVCSGSTTK